MNTKATIRKVLFAILWISIGGGMLTLLLAAISKKNKELCSDYAITIKGTQNNFFIDKKDITKLLILATGSDLKGRKLTDINLRQLEGLLRENVWIRDAEMWFDNRNVLHVSVNEREPVARIFTTTNNSFYIDSNEKRMPVSDKMCARVPVFTNFPEYKIPTAKDSALLNDVKRTAVYIMSDSFWTSQVAQIDISPEGNFDMVPLVGNHLVKLGNGTDIEQKFNRLMIFYKQVLSKTGFDNYSIVDVQYAGQVVGTKKGTVKNAVDSVQLRKNVENLLKQMQLMQHDSVVELKPAIEKSIIKVDSIKSTEKSLRATNPQSTNPNTLKAKSLPVKKTSLPVQGNKPNEKQPKAVMPEKSVIKN